VRRPLARSYCWLLLAYMAALLSKPMAVTLPLVLLLLDVWPLGRTAAAERRGGGARPGFRDLAPSLSLLLEKLPLLLLAGVVSAVTVIAQRQGGAMISLAAAGPTDRLANAVVAYATYLWKTIWPTNLAVFYPYDPALPWWQICASAVFLFVITVFVLRHARLHRYLLTGWFWYLITLIPVSGLVRFGGHALADRFTYLPLIGIFIMVAWGIPDLLRAWHHHQAACAGAAALALGACTVLTARQLQPWQDTQHLFEHALTVTRNNYVAHFMLGTVLLEEGRRDEAFTQFAETARIEPTYFKAELNMGVILEARGDREAAKQQYLAALRANPDYADAHNSLGAVLAAQGDTDGAVAQYREAIRLDPDFSAAHNNLAATLAKSGQTDEAIVHYTDAIRLSPQHPEPHWNLALVLQQSGHLSEAVEQFRAALQLNPQLVEMRYRLALAYVQAGHVREAEAELNQVLHEHPDSNAAATRLAWLLATADNAQLRDGARAVQLAEDTVQRTQQHDASALNSLAAAYAEVGRYARAADIAAQGIEAASHSGQSALRDALTARLSLYRAGQPVREAQGAQHP